MQAAVIKRRMQSRPEFRGTVMVEINISYPQVVTRGSPAGAEISRFYSEAASAYYDYATGELYNRAVKDYIQGRKNYVPFHAYTAMMTYEVPYNQNGFISIYTDIYEFTGGAHGNTVRRADTWSLKTGRHMQLPDFFTDPGYQTIIFSSILAQVEEQLAQGVNIYLDGVQKAVFNYFDGRNFYLTPQGFAIFYPLYTIAPYSSGIVTFIIPYSEFEGLLQAPLAKE